jgi:hypothetical protein
METRQSRLPKQRTPTQKHKQMTGPSLRDVALDFEWLPHTYDVEGTHLTFVLVPRAARSKLMFLSDEHFAGNFQKASFPVPAITAQAATLSRAPMHFIFHTSFCCSTLLAKALNVPGVSAALKEPDVLINLANRLIRSDDPANRRRLELVLRLLEKPPAPGESVIVKPTNFANRLVEPLMTSRPESRAILLFSDVGTFIRSLLKRGMWGRITARKLFNQLAGWSPLISGYSVADVLEYTDVQIAALAWLAQIHHLDAMVRRFGPDRIIVLDSADLIADPAAALKKAQALFELNLSAVEIEKIATGPVFSRHSKFSDRRYSAEAREQDYQAVSEVHADELSMVLEWIKSVAAHLGAPLRPGL